MSVLDFPVHELVDASIDGLQFVRVAMHGAERNVACVKYLPRMIGGQLNVGDVVVLLRVRKDTIKIDLESFALDLSSAIGKPAAPRPPVFTAPKSDEVNVYRTLGIVAEVDAEPTESDYETHLAWIGAKVDVSAMVEVFNQETELLRSIRNNGRNVRKRQLMQAMLAGASLHSPLIRTLDTTGVTVLGTTQHKQEH